jgi:hypothetical protein|tara:strand:- start:1290 stop:1829 length:540 start_codon:yes stop_codon:yes gene_type:complete
MLTVNNTYDTDHLPTKGNAIAVKVIGTRTNTFSVWLPYKKHWLECIDGRRTWFSSAVSARTAARNYADLMSSGPAAFKDATIISVPDEEEPTTPEEEPVTHLRYNSAEFFSVPNMFHNFMRMGATSWNSDASSIAAKLYGLASLFPDVPGGILLKMAQGNHDMVRIEDRAVIIDVSGGA